MINILAPDKYKEIQIIVVQLEIYIEMIVKWLDMSVIFNAYKSYNSLISVKPIIQFGQPFLVFRYIVIYEQDLHSDIYDVKMDTKINWCPF